MDEVKEAHKRPPSRWYWGINKKRRYYASPLRDGYVFESARASQMFDYIVKRDGPPKTERDLQFLFWYCGHKYASIVRDPDGNIVEEPEKYPTEE